MQSKVQAILVGFVCVTCTRSAVRSVKVREMPAVNWAYEEQDHYF